MTVGGCSKSFSIVRARKPNRPFVCEGIDRREVVCGGGAAVFGGLLAGLLGGSKPVRAQSLTGPVPELDRIAVRILIELCVTEAAQKTGLSAMRRAITARRICVDGLMEAFVTNQTHHDRRAIK